MLDTYRGQVMSALDELRTITTHDDNLERQYKEGQYNEAEEGVLISVVQKQEDVTSIEVSFFQGSRLKWFHRHIHIILC